MESSRLGPKDDRHPCGDKPRKTPPRIPPLPSSPNSRLASRVVQRTFASIHT